MRSEIKTSGRLCLEAVGGKMAKVIMALIANRKKILSKGTTDHATFTLGNTFIQLGMKDIIIDEMKYSLK